MCASGIGDPLDGGDAVAHGLMYGEYTRKDGLAISEYGARAAIPFVAPLLGTGEPQYVTQGFQEGVMSGNSNLNRVAVHMKIENLMHAASCPFRPADCNHGGRMFARTAGVVMTALAFASPLVGLGLPQTVVDRWLVATADSTLQLPGAVGFPDRNAEVGSGSWTLMIGDSGVALDTPGAGEPGHILLAHAYMNAPFDVNARLDVAVQEAAGAGCAAAIWVNNQPLSDGGGEVRLAEGWNTVLVSLSGGAACSREFAATVAPPRLTLRNKDERDAPAFVPRIQASRPPGVGANFPSGTISFAVRGVTGLSWRAGEEELTGSLEYGLTSWGAPPRLSVDGQRPRGRPGLIPAPLRQPDTTRPTPRSIPRPMDEPASEAPDSLASEADESGTGPTDPFGLRARMVAQLLSGVDPRPSHPTAGAAEIRVGDERIRTSASSLSSGETLDFADDVPFSDLLRAAGRQDGVRVELSWRGGDTEVEGRLPPRFVLAALQSPIALVFSNGEERGEGLFRVPDELDGFVVRGVTGEWIVDGQVVDDRTICSPCERGQRISIAFGEENQPALVTVVGYKPPPDLTESQAAELVEALERNPQRYRALLGG